MKTKRTLFLIVICTLAIVVFTSHPLQPLRHLTIANIRCYCPGDEVSKQLLGTCRGELETRFKAAGAQFAASGLLLNVRFDMVRGSLQASTYFISDKYRLFIVDVPLAPQASPTEATMAAIADGVLDYFTHEHTL